MTEKIEQMSLGIDVAIRMKDERKGRPRTSTPFPSTSASAASKNKRLTHHREMDRARAKRNYAKNKNRLRKLKETAGCAICGERFHASLDFHHVNPGEKVFPLSNGRVLMLTPRVVAEMKKCVLLCKNCHNKAHHGDLDVSDLPRFDPLRYDTTTH